MKKYPKKPPIVNVIGDRVKHLAPRAKYAHLDDDDKLVIIWGLSRGWSTEKIARSLPASSGTIKNYKAKIFDEPGLVFELPILVQEGPKSYECQICGERRGSRLNGMRHVLSHTFPYEVARDTPLDGIERKL